MNARQGTASGTGTPEAAEDLPWIEDGGKVAPKDARVLTRLFLDRLQVLEEGTREYQYARNTLIEMNLSLVTFAARRFRNRGSGDMEDIVQVGTVGLIKAIDRFDLSREVEFTSFAIPYIAGEIKRFFRDTSWAVHVPRRLQELRVDIAKSKEVLTTKLGRTPTVKDLSAHLELTEEEVIEGLVAANGYVAGSIDTPGGDDENGDGGQAYTDTLGEVDPALDLFEDLHALAPLLQDLDERERTIIEMRFGQEMTQAEIGGELNLSQMHISRLLSRTLTKLRTGLLTT
ncbi:SigB/SigF/SigG family RNA polymerase sigma factor [Streptomyces phaeochromogenes]|nr:SigB/SigF/SigG family RNA polymerase sigma factor [Streptomyces phaeochromogenes]MCX4561759.1 SigB/SigF/SigG family RNA polymerase sigma factor [Streptomyces phaeochromogenes]MCX5600914.1 SigB/SigF/SigG family RNA polymerase sigma factor [Streptomyces phaeochromogenes]WRZ36073.1 SigB/SigF/SigG family RNA polymerase sigma factor [Streptomyces phaeochromogenes]WSS99920.1 SigB/SigF/SigG family RNA polymerase sigma factor [Streptomyces phaeochromogenes]WSW21623.1 SigB/SigF/SigG family RNA polym